MRPNYLLNGDFAQDLSSWSPVGSAVFLASQGGNELGCLHLTTSGDSAGQDFSLSLGRSYLIQLNARAVSGSGSLSLTIEDDGATQIYSATIALSTTWQPWQERVGLPWGSFTLKLSHVDVAAYVDDVSLAFVIKTRAELAQAVHERLGVLASNASVSLLPVSGQGSFYGDPIDSGLRAVGAIDRAGRPDERFLTADTVDHAIDEIELAALHKLHRYWATKTDYSIGQRSESQSQISAAIDRLIGTAVGGRSASAGRSIKSRRLIHRGVNQ